MNNNFLGEGTAKRVYSYEDLPLNQFVVDYKGLNMANIEHLRPEGAALKYKNRRCVN